MFPRRSHWNKHKFLNKNVSLFLKEALKSVAVFQKNSIEKFAFVKQCQSHSDGETPEVNWLKGHINGKSGGITPCSGIINE